MKSMIRLVFLLNLSLWWGISANAQVPSAINIPGSGYPDLQAAIDSLNRRGVGAGGCVITLLPPATTIQAPPGGFHLGSDVLNASTSAAKTITIKGNGHTVMAAGGTGSLDGIFFIEGVDYLTIDSLQLTENRTSNTTDALRMEWGYALLKRSAGKAYDGCQYVTIRNCTITLDSANATAVAAGIYAANHLASNNTALVINTPEGTHSNNKFSGNVLQNLRTGISLNGFADPASVFYDQDNTIGGSTAALGNTIRWFGSVRSSTTAKGIYLVNQNNATVQFNKINNSDGGTANNGNLYGIFADKTIGAGMTCTDNTISLWQGGTSGTTYGIYSMVTGKGAVTISRNTLQHFSGTPLSGTSTSGAIGMIYTDAFSRSLIIDANKIINNNITNKNSGTSYIIHIGGAFGSINGQDTLCDMSVTNNIIDNYSRTTVGSGSHSIYGINLNSWYRIIGKVTIRGNTISNISNDRNVVTAILTQSSINCRQNFDVSSNIISGLTSSLSNVNGISIQAGDTLMIRNNTISNLTGGNTVTGLVFGQARVVDDPWGGPDVLGTKADVSGNNISDLVFTAAGSATQASVIGLSTSGGDGTFNHIYNNFISNLRSSSTISYSGIMGMSLKGTGVGGKRQQIFYNTIYLGGTAGITGIGATGIQFYPTDTTILYNNIIHINVAAGSGNNVAAIRRDNAGTAGTPVALTFFDANNNIYYAPSGANNYLYVEGTANSGLKNGFSPGGATTNATNNIVNDPDFNMSCSKYKSFLQQNRESGSFTEKNLAQIGATATFAPVAASYAESGAKVITTPPVTDDYSGTARGLSPDMGALQFNGISATTPPVIVYGSTPPLTTYCSDNASAPVITATITAAAVGINTTSGSAPRLYYKKSSENNAFGNYPADNNSSFNGWKYVEGTASGSLFSFAMEYTKFFSPLVPGDSVTYFIIAQDNAPTPNVVTSIAGFSAGCGLPGVNLGPSAGAVSTTPVSKGFRVLTVPSNLAAVASQTQYCTSGVAYLSVSPVPPGNISLQWQQDGGTGNWVDIPSANGMTYTSGTLTSGNNYRVQVRCMNTTIATSSVASITIAGNPSITGTTSDTRCGDGTVNLSATASGSSSVLWYDALTGGGPVYTGNTFTTPTLIASKTWYVSAFSGLTGGSVGASGPGPNAFYYVNRGLLFDATASFTLQSVAIYPIGTGSGTVTINLLNAVGNILQTKTVTLTGTAGQGVKEVVPLNFLVPQGNNYLLTLGGLTGGIEKLATNYGQSSSWPVVFPYEQPGVVSIRSTQWQDGTVRRPVDGYYYFYDWSISIGCESTPRIAVTATVNTPPSISLSAAPDTSICGSLPVDLSATSANTGYTYSWTPGGASGAQVTVTPAVTTMYSVTAIDNSGGPNHGCIMEDSIRITVKDKPVATFAPTGLTSFCEGDSVELHAGSGADTYQWQLDGTDIPGASNPVYVARDSGNYRVWVTNLAMCSDTSVSMPVNVYPLPTPVITRTGNVLDAPAGYTTYQWYNNGTLIPGATSASYTAIVDGNYSVVVTDGNSCEGASAPLAVTLVSEGIAAIHAVPVMIYPNPAGPVVYVDAPVPVNIYLSGPEGKTILHGEGVNSVNIGSLANGIYLMRITDMQGTLLKIEKLIKSAD